MNICKECNVEMIHTDYVGGFSFEEQIYLTYTDGKQISKGLFGKEKEKDNYKMKKVKARFCPTCGKVELFIDKNDEAGE